MLTLLIRNFQEMPFFIIYFFLVFRRFVVGWQFPCLLIKSINRFTEKHHFIYFKLIITKTKTKKREKKRLFYSCILLFLLLLFLLFAKTRNSSFYHYNCFPSFSLLLPAALTVLSLYVFKKKRERQKERERKM